MSQSRLTAVSVWATAIAALVLGGAALAAWPDSYAGRVANLNALRQDMAYPGIEHQGAKLARLYDQACNAKSSSACSYAKWFDKDKGGDLQKAAEFFKSRCPSDPQACVVLGWSLTRDDLGQLNPTDAAAGYKYFSRACTEKLYAAGCTGVGEMHLWGVGVKKDHKLALKRVVEGCKAKDPYGCYLAGQMYENGWGTASVIDKAVSYYRTACQGDVPHACVQLAVLQEQGKGLPRDPEASAKVYGEACNDGGFTTGCYHLGRVYEEGRYMPRNLTVAEGLYKQACDKGDILGCFGLATMYESGKAEGGDAQTAAGIYERACNIGNTDACTRLGKLYLRGKGVPKDPAMGVSFIQRACDGGVGDACDVLGQLFESGNGVEMNLAKASSLYKDSCDGGLGRGCFHLAKLYQVGKGVSLDPGKSGALFEQACDTGHGASCSKLATSYMLGDGVEKNMSKAAELLDKGCAGKDAEACTKVGAMYQSGKGVSKDPMKAVQYYTDACLQESGMACYEMAKVYQTGEGAEKDFKLAIQAYKDSCGYGYERACEEGGSIIFESRFQDITTFAFESKMCQVWSLNPDKGDSTRLVADVRGDEFVMMDGPFKGETIKPTSLGVEVTKKGKFIGRTKWEATVAGTTVSFNHFDAWDPAEDPIDAFPGDTSKSKDRADADTVLIYSRAEELVRRNLPATKCKFPAKVPLLTTEHCSEVQALIAAQLASKCKGE